MAKKKVLGDIVTVKNIKTGEVFECHKDVYEEYKKYLELVDAKA